MHYANAFLKLIAAQKIQGTLYNCGLDPHGFGKDGQTIDQQFEANIEVYGHFAKEGGFTSDANSIYEQIALCLSLPEYEALGLAKMVFSVECYLKKVFDTMIYKCGIRSFKPQIAFYEQFGPLGLILLSRLCSYFKKVEKEIDQPIINLLDCKRGDIATTQAAYFMALIGNLLNTWGINYTPYDFDIMNVTPWMGRDVLVLKNDDGSDGYGLSLMKKGKGLIVVNLTSNPSGPGDYQKLMTERGLLHMCNVQDLYQINLELGLETDGISTFGMVVGSTNQCDGSIRKAFPSATHLVPGFGAQGGKFGLIMPELIKVGPHAGHGAIFSSSRGSMFPFLTKLGGSGNISNFENDIITAVTNFRINEEKAYKEFGIPYPFSKAAA